MSNTFENLEWLAYSRGFVAFEEFIKEELPWLDIAKIRENFVTREKEFRADKEFQEWKNRNYVET